MIPTAAAAPHRGVGSADIEPPSASGITWHIELAAHMSPERIRWCRHLTEAAIIVFGRRGLANTKITEITEVAGVSRTRFYWLWTDKQSCFRSCLSAVASEIETRLEAKLAPSRENGRRGWQADLRTKYLALIKCLDEEPVIARFVTAAYDAEGMDDELRKEYDEHVSALAGAGASFLRHASPEDTCDPNSAVPLIALKSALLVAREHVADGRLCLPAAKEILSAFLSAAAGWSKAEQLAEEILSG